MNKAARRDVIVTGLTLQWWLLQHCSVLFVREQSIQQSSSTSSQWIETETELSGDILHGRSARGATLYRHWLVHRFAMITCGRHAGESSRISDGRRSNVTDHGTRPQHRWDIMLPLFDSCPEKRYSKIALLAVSLKSVFILSSSHLDCPPKRRQYCYQLSFFLFFFLLTQ